MISAATVRYGSSELMHMSDESAEVVRPSRRLLEIGREMGLPTSMTETEWSGRTDALIQRFRHLATIWRKECAHLSSIREMVLHPAYQQIVGMGPAAVPLIIRELEYKPDHWFWALRAITGEDPVLPEHRGKVAEMARDWLDWTKGRGIEW